jgi:hypothetical protein
MNVLLNFMERSPSRETDSSLGDEDIPRLLWNPKANYYSYDRPPPNCILTQAIPVYSLIPSVFCSSSSLAKTQAFLT